MCAAMDFALSYNYFLSDMRNFVNTESNIEFVNFLVQGAFPFHNFIKFIIAFPLLLFLLSWFDVFQENLRNTPVNIIERFGRICTLAIPGLYSISYSCSGFTWYTNSPMLYELLSVVESIIHGSVIIALCCLFLLTLYLLLSQGQMDLKKA